jgi:hypothetical protein
MSVYDIASGMVAIALGLVALSLGVIAVVMAVWLWKYVLKKESEL